MNTIIDGLDYGPLAQLVGRWIGSRGLDAAPERDGLEENRYTDEMTFKVAGAANNAEEQDLVAVQYRHLVRKQENGKIFHDQIGHWMYEPASGLIMHSLSIPRGLTLLAGGKLELQEDETIFDVKATADSETFGIVQSPFMLEKAKTRAFEMRLGVKGNELHYKETTYLHIYGKDYDHVDTSWMQRVVYDAD